MNKTGTINFDDTELNVFVVLRNYNKSIEFTTNENGLDKYVTVNFQ